MSLRRILRSELAALACLLAAGLLPRLAVVVAFPTIPVSDFAGLVRFASAFADGTWAFADRSWELYSPGLPVVLSFLLRAVDTPPDQVARVATAVVCGLVPALPYVVLRGTLPLSVRTLAGGLLALWPGQILFSGVVAQDNWVIAPTVALATVAVRALLTGRAHPVAAGLLFGTAVAFRQEMVVALLPLLAGGTSWRDARRGRHALVCLATVSGVLLGLAGLRYAATERFALSSEHAGLAVLGAYVPGATFDSWIDPVPHVASVAPELLGDGGRMQAAGLRLALDEALRRPGFHLLRMLSLAARFAVDGEAVSLYWSLKAPEVLPPHLHPRARAVVAWAVPVLRVEMVLIQGAFLAAAWVGYRSRSLPILVLAASVILKHAFHALTVAQGRYLLPATALELLAIALAVHEATSGAKRRLLLQAGAIAAAASALMVLAVPPLVALARRLDRQPQRVYRFALVERLGGGELKCEVRQGRVSSLDMLHATLETLQPDPPPGSRAVARCLFRGEPALPLELQVHDGYEPGGLPGRMALVVEVDGRATLRHDLASERGSGWLAVPLPTRPRAVPLTVSVVAVRPDAGAGWGRSGRTTLRLVRPGSARP